MKVDLPVKLATSLEVALIPNPPIVFLLLAAVVFGPMVYRVVIPPPIGDLKAIERFLKSRDEKLIKTRKLWIGGPSRWGGRGIYEQTGRPYRITALSDDGSKWIHDLAAGEKDALGNPKLMQRRRNAWSPVIQ